MSSCSKCAIGALRDGARLTVRRDFALGTKIGRGMERAGRFNVGVMKSRKESELVTVETLRHSRFKVCVLCERCCGTNSGETGAPKDTIFGGKVVESGNLRNDEG